MKPTKVNDIKKLISLITHEHLEFCNEVSAWPTSENDAEDKSAMTENGC